MATTTHADPAFKVWALQTRTDEAGADVIDSDAPEGRLPWSMYTPGVRGGDEYEVTASGASMQVTVGSGSTFSDLAILEGDTPGQGNYGVLLEVASVNLTVPAADLSNPRLDEVYLVVVDDPGTLVKARLAYRAGDAAASPTSPGPDASWDAWLLLGSVLVPTGATAIGQGDVTDSRPFAAARVAALQGIVTGGSTVNGTGELVTSFTNVGTASFTLPQGWQGAHILAWGAFYATSAAGSAIQGRVAIGASNGIGRTVPSGGSQAFSVDVRHEADVAADTTVALQGRNTVATGDVWAHPVISFIAYRTS